MTQNVHVAGEQLISYLYDEVDAGERSAVAAHLSECAACAAEYAGLSATRTHLAGWAPPDVALGFQLGLQPVRPAVNGSETAPAPATVLRPARWWSQPMPAWAQAVAAAAVFAAGLAVGTSRGGEARPAAPATQVQAPAPVVPASLAKATEASPGAQASASDAVTQQAAAQQAVAQQLARQVEQLRADMAALKMASASASASASALSSEPERSGARVAALSRVGVTSFSPAARTSADRAGAVVDPDLLARFEEALAQSEANMRSEFSLRLTQQQRDNELARRQDKEQLFKVFDNANTQTGVVIRDQGRAIEGLARVVSQTVTPGR